MKKVMLCVLAALMALTLGVTALAEAEVRYVNRDKLNVYADWDRDSKVIATFKGGKKVLIEDVNMQGTWAMILVEDTKHGGQRMGYIQTKYLEDRMPEKYCKHDWGKWRVTQEATCTEAGKRTRACSICGKRETETLKKLEHDWSKWKVTKEATCAEKGTRTRTCRTCGTKQTEEYLEDHTFGAWKMTLEPSCTEKGSRRRRCQVCGYVERQALEMLPHQYAWTVTLEPTDHSAGTRAKICQVCGNNGGEEYFDPEGTLRRGNRGEAVAHMQQLLVEQGYLNAGGADGIFGGGSEKALRQYQEDRGLNPDGVGWPQTLADLEHDFGPWQTVVEMTRAEAGERVRVCRGCGFEQRETIEPGTVYVKGDRGEAIRALQQLVKAVGYDAGALDGIYGRKLDAAMAGFAAAEGLVIQEGMIRPADVDALANAWLAAIPDDEWMGEGDADAPVDLALTVTALGDADDSGIQSYSWSLTNLGRQKANFTALLLTFGARPDFRRDDLVMALDGYELKPNGGNSISGSFSADADWGAGSLNFAALAMSDATGAKWLSNAVAFENSLIPEPKTVEPASPQLDANRLEDGEYAASFDKGDVASLASGVFMNAVHIFTKDVYDAAAVETLAKGDTLVVGGERVAVESVEREAEWATVNGGLDAGGYDLWLSPEAGGYVVQQESDLPTYTERGVTSLLVDPTATFTDAWDIDSAPVTVAYDGIAEAIRNSGNDYFVMYNTTLWIEDGRVKRIDRAYKP